MNFANCSENTMASYMQYSKPKAASGGEQCKAPGLPCSLAHQIDDPSTVSLFEWVEGSPKTCSKKCIYIALPMGAQWKPISSAGLSIGDPVEAAGI